MGLNESILNYLQAITLQQMLESSNKRNSKISAMSLKQINKLENVPV
jgi:hypothetical protein